MESLAALASWWIGVLGTQSLNVSVIFAVVLLVTRALRRSDPSIRLVLWCLVFVRLVLPPDLSHPWSLGALKGKIMSTSLTIGFNEARGSDTAGVATSSESGRRRAELLPHQGSIGLAMLWLLGAAAAGAVYRHRVWPFHEWVRHAEHVTNPVVRKHSEKWQRRLHLRRRVRIVTSQTQASPFTVGVIRPVVFIPGPIIENEELIESVVAHEMAHVARWDALWRGLQHAIQAVFFFHPLVWIAGVRLDAERERLCDATVVAAGRIPALRYVSGLLRVAELDVQGVGALTMSARKRRIGMRIQDILKRDGARPPRLVAAVAVASFLGIFLLPLAAGDVGARESPPAGSEKTTTSPASAECPIEFENPLPGGRVTWRWGPGLDPWSKEKVFHRGIDVAADTGAPVLAPADGVVTVATENFEESPTSGTVIIIDHGEGWTTFYAHLGSLKVAQNQVVSKHDVIAGIGSTGKSTGPHLHFEVRHNGEQLDPTEFVSDWRH